MINNNKPEGGFEVLDGTAKISDRVMENISSGDDLRKSRRNRSSNWNVARVKIIAME